MSDNVQFRLISHKRRWLVEYADSHGHGTATPPLIALWKELLRLRALGREPLDGFVEISPEDQRRFKL